ncbi:MAG: potassium transporter TrkG [Pseudotabrizicola sp.]|uniref:TrkH family potassium uptake protein n=1 Tax=Pseudotabrizicola sp. TaxID=2939647 RepID=UPI002731D347|nr:potassium transporter TrkG [Pseudotabrizicola sp.]MDP2082624.1 potassium transporter TrkG [Pseudotabrizicola sp.]MDZ7573520.1 potassium transporter TrkG [Pseudotabrizicola sp.]
MVFRERLLATPLLVILSALSGLAMFLPALHATLTSLHRVAQAFFYSGILVLIVTAMVWIATSNWRPRNVARSQLASLVGAYALMPVIFAIPVTQAVPDTSFVNAWFEMVSSFTTTGATLYDTPGRLAPSLHLWRATVGWLGGLFILVAATAILAPMNLGGVEVMSGRSPGRGADGLSQITRVADPSQRFLRYTLLLFPIYSGLTLLLWLLLMIAGEVNILALIHAMGTMSTSGIGMTGDLSGLSTGLWGEALIVLFLMLAITRRFLPGAQFALMRGPMRRDPEVRLASVLIATTTAVLFFRHFIGAIEVAATDDTASAFRALWGTFFMVVSFLTTTGYASGEWAAARSWSGLASPGLVLLGLAIIGGGVATTAGGVKLLRVYALFRHGERELEKLIHPSSIGGQGAQARQLRREGAYFAWLFFMLFALSIAVSTAALSLMGLQFEDALVLTLAALSTTGQLADLAGAAPIRYAELATTAKAFLAIVMVVGRLETLALLALLAPSSWQR